MSTKRVTKVGNADIIFKDNMIKVTNLSKVYKCTTALNDVSLEFEAGKIYGVLGRNGAGKTTLVNIITNRAFATSGAVEIDGMPSYENDKTQEKVFCITEKSSYPTTEKVSALFTWAAKFYPNFDMDYAYQLAKRFDLETDKKMGKLSTGYTTITKVVLTLASGAPYMIFDEPVLGIDAIYREVFYEELKSTHKKLNNCMILASHILDEIESVVDDVIILRKGRVVQNTPVKEATKKQSLQEFYLDLHKKDELSVEVADSALSKPCRKSGRADIKKIKHSLHYFFRVNWPQLVMMLGLSVLFIIMPLVTPAEMSVEIMLIINVLFIALVVHGYYFKYGLYNGVSRKTYFLSAVLFLVGIGIVYALLGAFALMFHHIGEVDWGIFYWLYGMDSFGVATFFTTAAWIFMASMFMMMLALFAMILFQALSRKGRYIAMIVVIAVVIGFMFWGMFAGASLANMFLFILGVNNFTGYAAAWFGALWLAILAAIFGVVSWLVLKRLEVK